MIDQKLLNFFYRWNRFEKQNNIDIIDFDLIRQADEYPGTFKDRSEVKRELGDLINEYKSSSDKDEFILAKLIASQYYLRALLKETISFDEYVYGTMGLKPKLIPSAVLNDHLKIVIDAFKKISYQYNKADLERYEEENRLSRDQIEASFKAFRDKVLPKFINWLDLKIDLKYRVEFVDIDAYWMNWISTDERGEILLRYNLNERQKWFKGSTEYLVFHEICAHAVQTLSWKQEIAEGRLNPFIGLTTVFSQEQFLLEGIAESLFYFYPSNPFSNYGLVSLYTDHLSWLVMNNAHIMANQGGVFDEIIQFVQSYFPTWKEKVISKNLKERTEDPLFRTYQYIYGIALFYHKAIASQLTKEQKREYVLDIYKNVYTPQHLLSRFDL